VSSEKWWSDDRLERVEPIGTRTSSGFWDGVDEHGNNIGGYGPLKLPEYPRAQVVHGSGRRESGPPTRCVKPRVG
jgi:hypothetical protein